ncbi:cation efflux system protein [Bacteroidia bacterium]|nr:cation efflux system protein [Bacteroidia bacterium]
MYNKFFTYIICLTMLFPACHRGQQHDSHHHEHEGHSHDHEGHSHGRHDEDEDDEPENHASGEIVLTSQQAADYGVVAQAVQPRDFVMTIKTSGRLEAAQNDEQTVVAPVSGIVSFAKPLVAGMSVGTGEALLNISARNIAEGDPVEKARLTYETAEKACKRATELAQRQLVSQSELEQIQLNYQTARLNYEALSGSQTGKGTRVAATVGGYIRSRWVNEGDFVNVGQPVLTVAQNRKLYLTADVPEKYFALIPSIVTAHFKLPYDGKLYYLQDMKGRLVSYARATDAASVYVPVVFELDNTGVFASGSFVEAYLSTATLHNAISLPLDAVIEEYGLYFVFKHEGGDVYKKQEVTIGDDNGAEVRILSGIQEGDRIVTQGALRVKLAANTSALPEHSH